MGRPYTRGQYEKLITTIAEHLPDVAIGADVLVGFPGESAKAFKNTVSLINELPLSYLHVFSFSKRPGTRAWELSDSVPPDEKKRRSLICRQIGQNKKRAFASRFRGKSLNCVVLKKVDSATGRHIALSGNYLNILLADTPPPIIGKLVKVKVKSLVSNGGYLLEGE